MSTCQASPAAHPAALRAAAAMRLPGSVLAAIEGWVAQVDTAPVGGKEVTVAG